MDTLKAILVAVGALGVTITVVVLIKTVLGVIYG